MKIYQRNLCAIMMRLEALGKRYRREDEIGTPYCVTIDFDTLEDNKVTIRDRDTMEQVRIDISEIENWLQQKIEF